MSQDRFQHVMALFEEALVLSGEEQAAFLDERCEGDESLRAELAALLACDSEPAAPLRSAGGGVRLLAEQIGGSKVIEAEAPGSVLPTLTGHYRVIRVIGEGGMGTVYEAEQSRPRRTVALKAIRPGLVSRQMLKRLEREAEMLGRLHHPGIAQVYEAGAADPTREDQAFFSMEYVRGLPLTTHCDQFKLDLRQRAELIAKVCDAVQHAHERRVIHRDLKPGNILVEETGQPKILDFGVARALDREVGGATLHTVAGQLVGTLPYMSPEQVGPDPDSVDARSDVYAVGVLLYQLAAGVLPHDLSNMSITEAARVIRDDAPRRPSSINPKVKGDLETIIVRALEKDASRRYPSAAAVAEDLRRWLQGLPIAAKEDSALYVLGKQVKRHRTAVSVIVAAFVGLAAFTAYSVVQSTRNAQLAAAAEKARGEAELARAATEKQLRASDIERGRLLGLTGNLGAAESLIWDAHRTEQTAQSRWALWELYSKFPCVLTIDAFKTPVRSIAMSRDQTLIATVGMDVGVKVWDAGSGELRCVITGSPPPFVVLLPSTGTLLTSAVDGFVREWDLSTGIELRSVKVEGGRQLAMIQLADEPRLAVGADDGGVRILNLETLAVERTLTGAKGVMRVLATDRTGTVVAGAGEAGRIYLWNSRTGELLSDFAAHEGMIASLSLTGDGKSLASGGLDRIVNVWTLSDTYQPSGPTPLEWTNGWVRALQYSRDGARLLSAGFWRVELWDTATRELDPRSTLIEQPPWNAMFSPDERYILTGAENGTVRLWESRALGAMTPTEAHVGGVSTAAVSGAGGLIVTGGTTDGQARVFTRSSAGLAPGAMVAAHKGRVWAVALAPAQGEGEQTGEFVTAGADGAIRRWRLDGAAAGVVRPPSSDAAVALAFSPDGGQLAASTRVGTILLYDGPEFKERVVTKGVFAANEVLRVAYTPDGTSLAATRRTKTIEFYDPATAALQWKAEADAPVWSLEFIRGTDLLAVGTWDSGIEVWDVKARARVGKLSGHTQVVTEVDYRPPTPGVEALLASSSGDGTIKLWDVLDGTCLATLRPGRGAVSGVSFVPGRDGLVSTHADGTVGEWDLSYYQRHIEAQGKAK